MIGIIDYKMGNLRSVQKAFEHVGFDAAILRSPDQAAGVDKLVLPGVGAFADAMDMLNGLGWTDAIKQFVKTSRPFLGICLGMQLLFDGSQEDASSPEAPIAGLGLIRGQVVGFAGDCFGAGKLKVPHMGWNTLAWEKKDAFLAGLKQGDAVYFVHGYYVKPDAGESSFTLATTDYGGPVCAALHADHIYATQFHPEKSQRAGLTMLKNFASLC